MLLPRTAAATCGLPPAPGRAAAASRASASRARTGLLVRAEGGRESPQTSKDEDELRLEALEAATRLKGGARASPSEARRQSSAQSGSSGGRAKWREGALFPDGWEAMNPVQKATELYVGERGFLFWANKAALASIVALGVGWVVFRFVGPALQLYALQNDLSTPSSLF